MPDVLLTHSYHLGFDAKQLRKMQPYPPLGTLYAATALRQALIDVAVFDPMLTDPIQGFVEALRKHQPRILAIYEDDFNFVTKMCLVHMRELTKQLADIAHSNGIIVIAHGSDATDHPEEYLDNDVDYILNGEAEQTLTELCSSLLRSHQPGDIPGLVYKGLGGGIVRSKLPAPKNPAWIELPLAARDLIDLTPYRDAWINAHGYFSTNIVASRGCPYRCNWCAKPISGKTFRVRNPAAVAAEMRHLKETYQAQHIWFSDDVFALNHRWVEEFAKEIEVLDSIVPFKVQSRADLMSESTITALKRAGGAEVWMGVESGSQKILDAMDKGLRISDVHSARERLAAAGIRACYFLQFGYPGEGWSEILETVSFVRGTRPDDIGVSVSYPLPGTRFYERVQAQLRNKRNWMSSDDLCVIFAGAYTDDFYRTLRDALHAEVSEWNSDNGSHSAALLWQRVVEMEPHSLNPNAFMQPEDTSFTFLPLTQIAVRPSES